VWTWTTAHENAWLGLKRSLMSFPVLRIFDPALETVLYTDSSKGLLLRGGGDEAPRERATVDPHHGRVGLGLPGCRVGRVLTQTYVLQR
jgi:hypothetical protein